MCLVHRWYYDINAIEKYTKLLWEFTFEELFHRILIEQLIVSIIFSVHAWVKLNLRVKLDSIFTPHQIIWNWSSNSCLVPFTHSVDLVDTLFMRNILLNQQIHIFEAIKWQSLSHACFIVDTVKDVRVGVLLSNMALHKEWVVIS